MKWIVEYTDEAAGMVRYGTLEVEANSKEEALAKVNKQFENAGPGIFPIGAKQKGDK